MKRFGKIVCACACLLFIMILAAGCGEREPKDKIRDLEFTVLEEEAVPKAMAEVIAENKAQEMKLSYQNGGYLYIARGFGEQKTGGYSIQVQECYLAEDGIHVKFELLGPPRGEDIPEEPSCPYIVIKMEGMEEPILFNP